MNEKPKNPKPPSTAAQQAREAQDASLARLPEDVVLDLCGPADGAADRIMQESLRQDKIARGLDPATAQLAITSEKWARKRRLLKRERDDD